MAKINLQLGKHPIMPVPYIKEIQKNYFEEILFPFFNNVPHDLKLVYVHADEKILRQRWQEEMMQTEMVEN